MTERATTPAQSAGGRASPTEPSGSTSPPRSSGSDSPSAAAFFDVDGTLAATTIAHYFRYFMFERLTPFRRRLWYGWFLIRCGYYVLLDRIDRGRLNRVFYRNYAGLPSAEIKAMARECHRAVMTPRQFDEAAVCVDEHRRRNHRVVLVTGSLDFIVAPLAEELGAAHVIAAVLVEEGGVFTGRLTGPPIGGEEKARRMRELAAAEGIDLPRSHAYGDSINDLAMLEAVGFPHVVNPDRRLAAIAASHGWPVHRWGENRPGAKTTLQPIEPPGAPQGAPSAGCGGEPLVRQAPRSPDADRRSEDRPTGVPADRR